MTGEKPFETSLGTVLKLERDGAAFFRRANTVAADPRVRQLFDRLARQREEDVHLIEDAIATAGLRPPAATGHTPYPFEAVSKVECYACGYVTDEIPTSCPKCGAARYAFEKEFGKSTVWEIAVGTGRAVVGELESAVPRATGGLRSALETLLGREKALLREAEGELASAKA